MGITGLLPFLEDASRKCHIRELRGKTAVVDSYCLLHRGAFACADILIRGEDTIIYVNYCLKYIKLLESVGIKPIMVFDGQHLAAKKVTEDRRRFGRANARLRGKELMRLGKKEEALQFFRKSVDITHEMALKLIKECRKRNVDCIVAPYEADAQMAYLNLIGVADVVITEDSDLIMFGCSKVMFKLDLGGFGTLVEKDKLITAMKIRPDIYTFDKFRHMCILSGCDYLDSLPGIGLKRAHKVLALTHDPDIYNVLRKLPQYINVKNLQVPPKYIEDFKLAEAAIKHQIVYDPLKRKLVYLTSPESCGTSEELLKNVGQMYDSGRAFQMALGNINPITLKVLDDWNPDDHQLPDRSIWSKTYTKPKPIAETVKSNCTKNKQITVDIEKLKVEEEQRNIEEDRKIAEVINYFHTHKPLEPKEEPEPIVEEISDEYYNEMKKYIPFISAKPLSKFKVTEISPGQVVRSVYFPKDNDVEDLMKDLNKYECDFGPCDSDDENKIKKQTVVNNEKENNTETKDASAMQKFRNKPIMLSNIEDAYNTNDCKSPQNDGRLSPVIASAVNLFSASKFNASLKKGLTRTHELNSDLGDNEDQEFEQNAKKFKSGSIDDNLGFKGAYNFSKMSLSDAKASEVTTTKNPSEPKARPAAISKRFQKHKISQKKKVCIQSTTILDMFNKMQKKD